MEMVLNSNYEKEAWRMMLRGIQTYLKKMMTEVGIAERMKSQDFQLTVQYHTYAIAGLLIEWEPKDEGEINEQMERLVRLMSGKLWPQIAP